MKRILIILLCFLAILLTGYLDLLTGPFFHFTVFYLIPIYITTWFVNRQTGIFLLIISAGIWVLNDILFSYSYIHPVVPYWNLALRTLIFSSFMYMLLRLKNVLRQQKIIATTDYLTGIYNRRQFFELGSREVERCKRYKRPISSIYIDIDNFKSINDIYGHKTGDNLLRLVGATLTESTRAIDLPGRLGGDEFAVILPETDYEGSKLVVKRIQGNLQNAAQSKGLPATFSLGAITCISPSCSFDTLIALSDIMMYSAKKEGKNREKHDIYDNAMIRQEIQKELSLRNRDMDNS